MIEIDKTLIRKIASNEARIDGRGFAQYRNIVIEPNIVTSAEGSARVKLGSTEVIAGVKIEIGEPFPDTPDEGVLIVSVEFVPLASPEFESGPPGEDAIEVARVVDRAVRESKCIDFKKLYVSEDKVWMIYVDIDILDNGGNLIDACGIASAAALMSAKIPGLDESGKPNCEKKGSEGLPMKGIPISATFVKISDKLFADPNLAEMASMDARLTVGTVDVGDKVCLCSMQKGGCDGFTLEEIDQIIGMAEEKSEELREIVKRAVGS